MEIVTDRRLSYDSKPLKVFDKRMTDMFNLLGAILTTKRLPGSTKNEVKAIENEARKQFLLMLVICYETYLRDIYKIIIEKDLVPISKILKIKKIREIKFDLEELDFISKNKIKLSEIICDYINFQNFNQMMEAFSVIDLKNRLEKIMENKKKLTPSEEKKIMEKRISKTAGKSAGMFMIHFFKEFLKYRKIMTVEDLFYQINLALRVRHKIVHRNVNIRITQDEINTFIMVFYEFVLDIDMIVNSLIKKRK